MNTYVIIDILENCGIAWPNPGMWLQAQQQFHNMVPPRSDEEDPEAHAHSPRRRDASLKMARARLDAAMGPSPDKYELMVHSGFQGREVHGNESCLSQHGADPFIGGTVSSSKFLDNLNSRNTTNSGDITMKSRSTSSSHDEPMPDAFRVPSPASRRRSILEFQAAAYAPGLMNVGSIEQNSHWQREIIGEGLGNHQFDDLMAAFTPHRKESALSGISAPSNTRASSAANTPPVPRTQPSTSAGLEVASIEGHPRSVSVTTRDPPPAFPRSQFNTCRSQSGSQEIEARLLKKHEIGNDDIETTIKHKPAGRPRGRKEGKNNEQGLNLPSPKPPGRTSTGSANANANGQEISDESDEKAGDCKRKRVSSMFGTRSTLSHRAENLEFLSPTRKVSKIGLQDDTAAKLGEIDELTEDGVAVRKPLGELENMI